MSITTRVLFVGCLLLLVSGWADAAPPKLASVAPAAVGADFDDEVDKQPTSLDQELPLIKDCAGQLATIARGSLFPDNMAGTCILQAAKAAVTLLTPNNQPRPSALEQGGNNNA